ncbi:hypothetical protein G5B39_04410 [Rhodobacteraceae bacterium SC52]|nr:hypothetical protein G5B39_04410 [Rhodobacteraceae bacterium SC52]
MKLDLKYYFSIFLRRSPYFIVVAALFASIGLTVAIILPAEYEAKATLLVESEQIPERLASSTVNTGANEQLLIIQQRLLSRENLLDVANRLDLYPPDEEGVRLSASSIVQDMRDRVTFSQNSTTASKRGPETSTIMTISYRGKRRQTVAEVTNEFVTLVLQQNLELRTEQASDTLAFFRQEVDRLGGELDAQSVRLIDFQNQVGMAVPTNLSFLRTRLDDLQTQRSTNRQSILDLEEQKKRIEAIFRVTGDINASAAGSPLEQQLKAAQDELNNALLVFSPTNPRVTMLKARVAQIEQQLNGAVETPGDDADEQDSGSEPNVLDGEPRNEREVRFQAEMDNIDRRIQEMQAEIEVFSAEIAEIEEQISDVPANGVTLAKLQRDFDNIQGQYNQAVNRLSVAATGERIELLSKGQRTSVIEQATPPERPTKPNRPLIAAAGAGFGVFAGLALIVLMEFLNRSIRRPMELTNRLGITPFAVLPYIRTHREVALRRTVIFGTAGVLIVLVPLSLFAMHSFVYPLDTIIESLFNRVGLSVIG